MIMNRSAVVFFALVLLVTLAPPAHAQQLQLRFVSPPGLVRSGDDATIAVQTDPGAACQISVRYNSGPSDARALRPKTADARGMVSWTWHIVGDLDKEANHVHTTRSCFSGTRQGG